MRLESGLIRTEVGVLYIDLEALHDARNAKDVELPREVIACFSDPRDVHENQ